MTDCKYPSNAARSGVGRMNICCGCENFAGGCPWSERFEPVEGWDAKMVSLRMSEGRAVKTYTIKGCPLYEEDARFKFGSWQKKAEYIINNNLVCHGVKQYGNTYKVWVGHTYVGSAPTWKEAVRLRCFHEARKLSRNGTGQ